MRNAILKSVLVVIVLITSYAVIYSWIYRYDRHSDKIKVLETAIKTEGSYISETDYASSMKNIVRPFLDSIVKSAGYEHNGHTIAYNMYLLDHPKANVVLSHGYSERKEKYEEMVYYLLKMGYQVFVPDHYGHGNSARYNADSCLVYAPDYHIFINDLNGFITQVVRPQGKGLKTVLFGHSMGGAIAARAVEMQPGLVDGLILNAPLMKLGTPGTPPEWLADALTHVMILCGQGAEYALNQRAYNPKTDIVYHPENPATFCEVRGRYWHNYQLTLTRHPTTGASWQLASDFLELTHDVINREQVGKINIPILLFQAEKDGYTAPEGHYTFANRAAHIQFFVVKGAGHEIYIESDHLVAAYFDEVHRFIRQFE